MQVSLSPLMVVATLLASIDPRSPRVVRPQMAAARTAQCVKVESPARLYQNASFQRALPRQLEFRLEPDGRTGWRIKIGPQGEPAVDYVWVVSPPYQTAPQLYIGPVYGLTAQESTELKRELRFVLTADDYVKAFAVVSKRPMDVEQVKSLRASLVTGALVVSVTGSATREIVEENGRKVEGLEWITFTGEACVPD